MKTPVLLSIHDVMPSTLADVQALITGAIQCGWAPPDLLVVPGVHWQANDLAQLQRWQSEGHHLVGHGWYHRMSGYGSAWHRLHSALISRDVAEHLSLASNEILELMRRCHAWFGEQGLRPPRLYVPPAWALGAVSRHRLTEQPFSQVETLRGIYDVTSGHWHHQALLGYEAGNGLQHQLLKLSNRINRFRARRTGLRIGLHPLDAQLPLADALWDDLRRFSPQLAIAD